MVKKYIVGSLGMLILLFFDQWTKHIASISLKGKPNFVIIKKIFELEYLENRGAAFGILQNQRLLLLGITLLIFGILCVVYYRIPAKKEYIPLQAVFVVIGAGAIGNMFDRFLNGYVVDFFYVSCIDFPIFNVADCYVVVGVFVLAYLILFRYSEEELDSIWGKQKKVEE
ncbi:MAG: signal peptidase II [Lachnospiraceae bacterium]|nr:signal peptidase II [Lachnospiraceae bacterium]